MKKCGLKGLALSAVLAASSAVGSAPLLAQVSFLEVASQVGIGEYDMLTRGFGAGVAAADFDDDGDVDLFLPTAAGVPHQLYRNLGNGQFEEVATSLGLGGMDRGRGSLWFDYDGDHRLDLLVSSDCYQTDCLDLGEPLRLFRQTAAGAFEETTSAAGLLESTPTDEQHRSGIAAGDVNGDGYLDFAVGYWMGTLQLYLNQGDGTFFEISAASGIDDASLGYHQPMIQDFDGDGKMDLFSTVDFTENRLWLNQGNLEGVPIFVEGAGDSGCANAMNDMGVTLGDFNGDGAPDFYITNIYRDDRHNVLLRHEGLGTPLAYTEASGDAGVQDGGWGWGTTFLDADNDGWLDIAETNGWSTNAWQFPPRLFMNQGDSPTTFVDRAADAGLTETSWGSSLVAVDYDRDGDLDLVETIAKIGDEVGEEEVRLHQNQLDTVVGEHHYLVIRPRMSGPNGRAIGAQIEVQAGGTSLARWITAGTSYQGQEPAEAFFGLGSASVVDRVTVTWPGGAQSVMGAVAADQVLTVQDDLIFSDSFEAGDSSAWSITVP